MPSIRFNRGFDRFILGFKFLSVLAFIIIFLYWSITALVFFESGPIASSVSYRFGDDGLGYYEFPAVSICLDSFKWIRMSPNGMKNNCSRTEDTSFAESLLYCTYDNKRSSTNRTEGELIINNSIATIL